MHDIADSCVLKMLLNPTRQTCSRLSSVSQTQQHCADKICSYINDNAVLDGLVVIHSSVQQSDNKTCMLFHHSSLLSVNGPASDKGSAKALA